MTGIASGYIVEHLQRYRTGQLGSAAIRDMAAAAWALLSLSPPSAQNASDAAGMLNLGDIAAASERAVVMDLEL